MNVSHCDFIKTLTSSAFILGGTLTSRDERDHRLCIHCSLGAAMLAELFLCCWCNKLWMTHKNNRSSKDIFLVMKEANR